jgi:rhodanese-related sulfurtransferase
MINPEEWVKKVGRLVPIDKSVILLCRLGNRTIPACQLLADAGYSKIYNVTAGITAWIAEGMPIEKFNLR